MKKCKVEFPLTNTLFLNGKFVDKNGGKLKIDQFWLISKPKIIIKKRISDTAHYN